MPYLSTIAIASAVFVATNLDNLVLLMIFFADPRNSPRQVILGNFLGSILLLVAGILFALVTYALPHNYTLALCAIPLFLGSYQLTALLRSSSSSSSNPIAPRGAWTAVVVAAIGLAHGTDNIAAYGPLFATSNRTAWIATILVFLVMITLWNFLAQALVTHPLLSRRLRRIAPWAAPVALIAFGLWLLAKTLLQ